MPRRAATDFKVHERSKRKERKIENEADLDAATIQWKKDYAVIMKASDHSYSYMSNVLGVTTRMVRGWFEKDEDMRDRVAVVQQDMSAGALKLLNMASVEAAQIILQSARGALSQGMWKEARDSAAEVLDRTGLSKVNKSDSKVTKVVEHETSEGFFDKFQALPHETQVQIAQLMGEVEDLVQAARGSE